MPKIGDIVMLNGPYNEVEVTDVGKVWVHIKPHNRDTFHDQADAQPPTRIKRKHWANKLAA